MKKLPVRGSCQYVEDGYERLETNQLPNYVPVNHKKLQLEIGQQQMYVECQASEEYVPLLSGILVDEY